MQSPFSQKEEDVNMSSLEASILFSFGLLYFGKKNE